MRLLVHEYLCAGGMADAPASLLREGWAMLSALVEDARGIPGLRVRSLLGRDGLAHGLPNAGEVFRRIDPERERQAFLEEIESCAAVLVVAPECDGILADRCRLVRDRGKLLLNLDPAAIDIAADKVACGAWLQTQGVPTPPTHAVEISLASPSFPLILKPRFGAGCLATFVVDSEEEWWKARAIAQAEVPGQPLVMQPFLAGIDASAAYIVGGGRVLPLRAGNQGIARSGGRLSYEGGSLPLPPELEERALALGNRAAAGLAKTFPASAGFVGVDLILGENPDGSGDVVVEINPRLTTSYVGLRQLTEENLLLRVLEIAENRWAPPPCWRPGTIRFTPSGETGP